MLPNPILYNDATIMAGFIVCCLIVLAVVIIPKAMRYRKQMKQNEREKSVPAEEQEVEMKIVPSPKLESTYREKFLCRNEIKKRDCVYISHEIHSSILKLIRGMPLDGKKMTIGGYIDTVLREHLKEYKDDINKIYSESRNDLF